MPWEITANIKGPPGDPADISALQAEIGDPHIVAAHTDLVGYIGEIDERLLLLEGSGEPPTATSHLFVDNYSNGFIRVSAGSISASITVDLALATTPGPGGAIYPTLGDIPGQAAAWADFNGTLGKMKTSQGADVLGAAIKEWIRKGSILTVHKDTTDAAHPALVVDTIVTPTPAGSNLSLGHLKNVDPTADSAATGKVLGTTAVGQWGAIDPPAGGLSQAEADARYLRLSGGRVEAGAVGGAGTSFLAVDSVFGAVLGTTSTPGSILVEAGITIPAPSSTDPTQLGLISEAPVRLYAPDGTQPNELVSKGYVDSHYLPLTGGTVQTRHTTIYGHSLLLDMNEDEGLMLGTMGPDPDGEFSGIIWTPPMVPGRNGSRVNLSSEFPIMLQTPAATLDAELVDKGYVDAKTKGHCRGGLSGTVPSGTATKLTLAKHQGTADVTISGTAATVNKAGYWAISAMVSSTVAAAAGSRCFTSILLLGSPDSVISRASYGTGESFLGVNAVVFLEAGQRVGFDYYNAGAAATVQTSFFYFKYLGDS